MKLLKINTFGYVTFSVFLSSLGQVFVFNLISFGEITDLYFLISFYSQIITVLFVSSIQNVWLAKLSDVISTYKIKTFLGEGLMMGFSSFIIQLFLLTPIAYYFLYNPNTAIYFYSFSILFSFVNFFQIFSSLFFVLEIASKRSRIVEKVELESTFVYLISLFFIVYFKKFYLIPLPLLFKYLYTIFYFYTNWKFKFKFVIRSIRSYKKSVVNYFIFFGAPSKFFPLIDRFVLNTIGVSIISIYSIWDSGVGNISRIIWRSFGLPKVPYINSIEGIKSLNNLVFNSLYLLSLSIIAFLALIYFNVRIPFNLFNIPENISNYFWLIGLSFMPSLLLSLPISLIQNYMYSINLEKRSVDIGLHLGVIYSFLKIFFFFFFDSRLIFLVIFLQRIVDFICYFIIIRNKIKI